MPLQAEPRLPFQPEEMFLDAIQRGYIDFSPYVCFRILEDLAKKYIDKYKCDNCNDYFIDPWAKTIFEYPATCSDPPTINYQLVNRIRQERNGKYFDQPCDPKDHKQATGVYLALLGLNADFYRRISPMSWTLPVKVCVNRVYWESGVFKVEIHTVSRQ